MQLLCTAAGSGKTFVYDFNDFVELAEVFITWLGLRYEFFKHELL
jgi:hypothetical protein